MNEEAQAAQTILNTGIKTAEVAGRGTVAVAKNAAALIAVLAKSKQKTAGRARLKKLQSQENGRKSRWKPPGSWRS